ncbi:IS3 family transposase [Micromonospora eburnea]|uniref:Transposase InsO and inactivated derivatives n=1 Tax=Micromonospora eburnea TaxID=227316 RepID=A0A1C6TSV2_9ACTN|nr:Transposase InsO and inactivated derivatives [Micromonospora eburnea]
MTPAWGIAGACRLTGVSRATLYRHRTPPLVSRPRTTRKPPPSALSEAEREQVLQLLNRPDYQDLAPAQVWARELDEGRWWCSESTMYRILRAAGQSGERRSQASHPARTKPELVADAANHVWSWDITKLRGPDRGVWFHLYTVIDIWSRYVVGHLVAAHEDGQLAEALIADAAASERVDPDQLTVHADRGAAMTSKTVTQLLTDLKIGRSHSRPKTSNDNPYIEASFKTLKYDPSFPDRFGSIQHARQHCEAFYTYYNHEHRHSGIGLHTPASVHHGTAGQIREQRQQTLDAAWVTHPERFGRRPRPPRLPERAWINKPDNSDPEQTTGPPVPTRPAAQS